MEKLILKSGWGKADITPKENTLLRGQHYTRISTHTNDPLYANALAFKGKKDELLIWISFDLIYILKDDKDLLAKELIKEIPGLKEENLICSCIHNHTGPYTNSRKYKKNRGGDQSVRIEIPEGCLEPEAYVNSTLIPQTVRACKEACSNLSPTGFSPVLGHAVVGHCRRILMRDGSAVMYGNSNDYNFDRLEGPCDHGIEMMYLYDMDKKLKGLILNVNCPAQVLEHKCYFTADFIGAFRSLASEKLGYELPVLSLIGAAGNISPRDLVRQGRGEPDMHETEGAVELGRRLVKCFLENLETAENKIEYEPEFVHIYKEVALPIRTATQAEIIQAKAEHERLNEKYNGETGEMTRDEISAFNRAKLVFNRAELQNKNALYNAPVHAVRIGNSAFITNPFELYIEYGMRMRARAKAVHTFIAQLTDDAGGYLPTMEAVRAGGYSTAMGSCVASCEGGELLAESSIHMINDLFKGKNQE